MAKPYTPIIHILDLPPKTGLDIIGDVHGCFDELCALIQNAGYEISRSLDGTSFDISHPEDRRLFLVGDVIDRGPNSLDCLRLVKSLFSSGVGGATIGNHEYKCVRVLAGKDLKIGPGLQATLEELDRIDPAERKELHRMIQSMPTQILVRQPDSPEVLIVHASAHEHHQMLPKKRSFERSIYGYPTDIVDEHGYKVRGDWAEHYEGERLVVHGHVPGLMPAVKNNVFGIDTGCAFGNHLTMLRIYEEEFMLTPARKVYHDRPGFLPGSKTVEEIADETAAA